MYTTLIALLKKASNLKSPELQLKQLHQIDRLLQAKMNTLTAEIKLDKKRK